MRIAQSLYEGLKLGKGEITGLITYMRTDSTRLSNEIVDNSRDFIKENYGKEYLHEKARSFEKKNKKNIQDAHEAIRPTSLAHRPEIVKEFLDDDQFKLYQLIWQRFIACQMEAADIESTSVSVSAGNNILKASGSVVTFDGFLKVYSEGSDEGSNGESADDSQIPAGLVKQQELKLQNSEKSQQFTKPVPRYTESTLIKELESNGIGRPSTYASIIGTIQDRYYIEQNERKLIPTDLGKRVNKVLVKNFPKILDVNFTAQMEEELDLVASGDNQYKQVLDDFYIPFSKRLKEVENTLEKVLCEKCGSEMELKIGRFGKYFACTGYPECKNIKSANELKTTEPEYTGETCPECGSRTVIRSGKFGKFIGCEKYPDCNFTKQLTLGIKCPSCKEGEVVTRRAKSGRFFYGCSNYPDCDYISWNKPTTAENSQN
jgi:DNA topoisomerase-1